MRLLGDVRLDDVVRHVATTAAKVAACPHVAAPKLAAQLRKLREQAIGTLALHPLDQATDGDLRWDGDHDMDMIRGDMALQDIDSSLLALFPDDGTDPLRDLTAQRFVAILGDPDNMQMNAEGRVRPMAIVTHTLESIENLLKLPPKGGGFNPPNWGQ